MRYEEEYDIVLFSQLNNKNNAFKKLNYKIAMAILPPFLSHMKYYIK